jgi:hypothetical protein
MSTPTGESPQDAVRDSFLRALAPYQQHELDPHELTLLNSADVRRLQPSMSVRTEQIILNSLLGIRREDVSADPPVRVFRRATGLIALNQGRRAFVGLEERRYLGQIEADGKVYDYTPDRPIFQATALFVGKGTAVQPDAMARYTYIPAIGFAEKRFYSRLPEADAPHKVFNSDTLQLQPGMTNREAAGAIAMAAEARRQSEHDILELPYDNSLGVSLPSDPPEAPLL